MKKKKILFILVTLVALFSVLALSACTLGEKTYDGPSVAFALLEALWGAVWTNFTPWFWGLLEGIWTSVPGYAVWLAGPLAYLLSAILYAVVILLAIVAVIILAILSAVIWVILAILNGIFHFL